MTPSTELVSRATDLLKQISPYPWKLGEPGTYALQTRDGEYLAESIHAWSCPRGPEMRDRDMEMASLAPELAAALIKAEARIAELEGENAEGLEILRGIVGNANEAMPMGPFDCIDNRGEAYQSEAFQKALDKGRKFLARASLRTSQGGRNE